MVLSAEFSGQYRKVRNLAPKQPFVRRMITQQQQQKQQQHEQNAMEIDSHSKELHEQSQTPSTEELSDPSALEGTTSTNSLQLSTYLVPTLPAAVGGNFQQLGNGNVTSKLTHEGEVEEDRKKEHKRRSKNWTRMETLKLIRARSELDERFRRSGRKAELWDEIARTLQSPNFARDGQQCKDKWEKLTAGYKEVKDGTRNKEDHPYYEQLHQLLSWKPYRRDGTVLEDGADTKRGKGELAGGHLPEWKPAEHFGAPMDNGSMPAEPKVIQKEEVTSPGKRKRSPEYISLTDLTVVHELLETIITRQQVFFKDLLDAVEQKELLREKIRHDREEKWRAEERHQRVMFHNAMILLTQRLLGERPPGLATTVVPTPTVVPVPNGLTNPKKRSKNWKRTEVLHLIRFRRDMESRFLNSTRRAGLWDELGEKLASLGIKRDGKQCREKWDKLVAEYKDVIDGRKDKEESPYFAELTTFLGRAKQSEIEAVQETLAREENAQI